MHVCWFAFSSLDLHLVMLFTYIQRKVRMSNRLCFFTEGLISIADGRGWIVQVVSPRAVSEVFQAWRQVPRTCLVLFDIADECAEPVHSEEPTRSHESILSRLSFMPSKPLTRFLHRCIRAMSASQFATRRSHVQHPVHTAHHECLRACSTEAEVY